MNTIAHFEIHSTDLERSAPFYRKPFSWRTESYRDTNTLLLMGDN